MLVDRIFKLKSSFDDVPPKLFRTARSKSNPYEKIGKEIFQNRAAMKMANLDSLFGLVREDIVSERMSALPMFIPHPLDTYADICAGPGGFTEYICWRC